VPLTIVFSAGTLLLWEKRKERPLNRQYQFQLGQQVSYILLPMQQPTYPDREYHGIITGICPEREQIRVKLIDPEYEGLEEWIEVDQICFSGGDQKGEQNTFT
jgi:hypothetical protein